MKRKPFYGKLLKHAALAVPAAALMLGASHAAQVGINFQDNWGGTPYAPLTDATAFGIPLASWYNAPAFYDSGQTAFSTNGVFSLPGGGELKLAWSAKNTYSLYAAIPESPGDDQVIYGYLDDSDYGYTVTLTGLRAFASSFTIKTIAATDSGDAFQDVNVFSATETNTLQYLANYVPSFASGLAGMSTVSPAFVTLNGNDSVTIRGVTKSGTSRSCLAGFILDYTPGGSNPPLIETEPTAPTGTIFTGQSFDLAATASGSPTLAYQWRKDGATIDGATTAVFSKSGVTGTDTGAYDLVVTNSFGAVTSTVAQVVITDVSTPVITKGPTSQSFYAGYPVTFTVEATGGQLSYQWKLGSTAIEGATDATLALPSITAGDQGAYMVEVSNPVGPTATASATLTVKTPTSGYEAAVAQTKPLVWYRYAEASTVYDSAMNSGSLGTSGKGLYLGSATHPVAGALAGDEDTAASFAGGRVAVAYTSELNPSTFSIEAWLQPAVTNAAGTLTCPLASMHVADPREGWNFYQSSTGWNFRTYNQNGTTPAVNITGGPVPVAGQWYHVVATWDGNVGRVYVNGVLSATSDPTTFVATMDAAFTVGARSDGNFVWSGAADEVACYASVLSDAQILAHYQNGMDASRTTPYATLVANDGAVEYLRLNESTFVGPVVNDGTLGAAWNGSYNGNIQAAQTGPRPPAEPGLEANNTAVTMDNGFVSAAICPALNVNTVTVAGWMKRAELFTTGDLSWPCWLGDGGMHLNDDTSPIPGELRYHWKGAQWGWASGLVVPADTWTFIAMVVEPTKATFYMSDGTTLKSSVHTATHAALAVSSPLGFGGNQPGRADRTYNGGLDEMTVYSRALTQSEINALFMVGTGAKLSLSLTPGGVIEDTKPAGTPHHGYNSGTTWLDSSTDANPASPVTRTGVQQFSTANSTQIRVPSDADFDSTVGTICFWMRFNGNIAGIPGPGSEAAMLMDRRTGSGTVITLNDAGNIFVQCSGGANSLVAGYLPDDLWHHVAVTYDQSASGSVAIYIDGVFNTSNPNTAAWSWPAGQPIELGRSHDGYWKRYDGLMDDFRIYNRVLTDTEITQVFTSDALVDTAALKLRYEFTTRGIGHTVAWPFGTLETSPTLNPGATWTPVSTSGAYPFLPTEPSLFFRAKP